MTRPDRTDAGVTAFLLTQIGSMAAQRFGERVGQLGLTPAQAGVLRIVGMEPGCSQQYLARQLGLVPSRLVTMIDELQDDGLVERRRNETDRRVYALHLTPGGRRRLGEIARVAYEHGVEILDGLDGGEQDALQRLLTRLAEVHALEYGVHPGYRTLDGRGS